MLFIIGVKVRPIVLWYTPSLRDTIRYAANNTLSLPAMNMEEVQFLFAAWIDVFDPISGKPTDADLTRLLKELTLILLPLPCDVENWIHNLIGLIMDEDDYKVRYGAKFPTNINSSVYDKDIPNNATYVVQA